jgi:DNA-binding NtrC family response regulator
VIQLLLTDLVMPDGMTGIELGRKLLEEKPDLPIIYISGYSRETAGASIELHEGVNFLPKPFQVEKLAQIIRSNLDAGEKKASLVER